MYLIILDTLLLGIILNCSNNGPAKGWRSPAKKRICGKYYFGYVTEQQIIFKPEGHCI